MAIEIILLKFIIPGIQLFYFGSLWSLLVDLLWLLYLISSASAALNRKCQYH